MCLTEPLHADAAEERPILNCIDTFWPRRLSGGRSASARCETLDSTPGGAYRLGMSEAAEPIIRRFRKLPPPEKIRLVQRLWDEIADEAARLPLTDVQRQLLDERIDDHEANPDDVEPWEQARDEILRKL